MFIYFHESLISLDDLIFATALGDDIILYNRQGGNRISCLNHFDAVKAIQELYDILIAKGYAEADADDLQVELDDDELAVRDQIRDRAGQHRLSAPGRITASCGVPIRQAQMTRIFALQKTVTIFILKLEPEPQSQSRKF